MFRTLTEAFSSEVGDRSIRLTRCFCGTNIVHDVSGHIASQGGRGSVADVRWKMFRWPSVITIDRHQAVSEDSPNAAKSAHADSLIWSDLARIFSACAMSSSQVAAIRNTLAFRKSCAAQASVGYCRRSG